MGMLLRYQRPGGFVQLLQLIETCGKQKQSSFLNIIESEDPRWANAVREKMITMDRIFTWDDNTIAEIFARMSSLTLATAMHGLSQEQADRFLKTFSHAQKRNLDDLFNASTPPQSEISAAYLKILQEARTMIVQGYLRVEKFAPQLLIPENYEESLMGNGEKKMSAPPTPKIAEKPTARSGAPATKTTTAQSMGSAQVQVLQNKIHELLNENAKLKTELAELKQALSEKSRRQSAA